MKACEIRVVGRICELESHGKLKGAIMQKQGNTGPPRVKTRPFFSYTASLSPPLHKSKLPYFAMLCHANENNKNMFAKVVERKTENK